MDYSEKMKKIEEIIRNKNYDLAEQELLKIIDEEEIKEVEDEKNIHFSFYNYIENLIYWNKYRPSKKLIPPINNIADVYYMLGFINFETKNYGKAIQYLNKAIEWNPISPRMRMEKADAYRNMGEIERFKAEVEKTYQYIYESTFMSKYYRELGWYYSEKRIFDLANALYTQSTMYMNTELASNELRYIAQQENREPRLSTQEEVKRLFTEYNIPFGISNDITKMIYDESQRLLNENNPQLVNYLYRALYDITLDKRFMLYVDLKDEETKLEVKIPEIWRTVNKEAYSKFGISDNTIFLFLTPQNENISIVCDGKCNASDLDKAYKLNIENMKKKGIDIEKEFTIRGQKNINQVFVLVQTKEKLVRIYQNYLVVNGYLFNVSWEVPNSIPIEKLMESENNSFRMQMVFSLKGENEDTSEQEVMNEINRRLNEQLAQGKTMKEAMEIVFGDNAIFSEIKNEFINDGITPRIADLLQQLSIQLIKDTQPDPFWSDISREVFKILILSNLMQNKEFTLQDLVEQTNNEESVRKTIINNLDKIDLPELQSARRLTNQNINSDKPFSSVVEIIREAVLPYARTELQEKGRKELQDNKKENTNTPAKNKKMNEYSQEIKGLPTFKFYFPENMGEYNKFNDNVFELKKDNIQKIRVMISKCDSEENFEKDAKAWIEKNKVDTKMEEVAYRKEKIGNYPIEVYELKTQRGTTSKIYKIGYVNHCRITISGRKIGDKERIINEAFETIKWDNQDINEEAKQDRIDENKEEIKKEEKKPLIIKCMLCKKEFQLNWIVPASEKTFYCKCPNCNAEIKYANPNYKG